MNTRVGDKWGGIAVMAHEIGHHLEAHTISPGGSNPEEELEADEFAGWALRRVGATNEQALALFRTSDAEESATHPARSDRLVAVENGYQRAGGPSPSSCYARSSDNSEQSERAASGGRDDALEEAAAQGASKVSFGDDNGRFANDGECDDVRFDGAGRSVYVGRDHIMRDASDCRMFFDRGLLRLRPEGPGSGSSLGIDFGDDSGRFADDGECDDVRFVGVGRSVYVGLDHIMRDASDCRSLFDRGLLQPVDDVESPSQIDFGDDSGRFADDGECDDVRFDGAGRSVYVGLDHIMRDASDCRVLFDRGLLRLRAEVPHTASTESPAQIDFGDDSGRFADDGECDDARFAGLWREMRILSHVRRDASDCREALARERTYYLGDL